ncbi:MAG: ABC-F family ATP-binding cassette domain-containing protein [Chitinophagaceae bacterium]|nr:ABC-F family ATP-binding cassette domain-containing protein [Chitinophagaceae bacterium]
MLHLQDVTYMHPNRDTLFSHLYFNIHKHRKIALVGNNGAGKTTLLQLLAGRLQPAAGAIKAETKLYYVPQLLQECGDDTVAAVLQVAPRLNALQKILSGDVNEETLQLLNDDWTIEERCREAFAYWDIVDIDLYREMRTLSGGQKTKVLLSGIMIHRPGIVLLDEPSNHLDTAGRNVLYHYIQNTNDTLVVVSHDRVLLNLLPEVYELNNGNITVYGGNYDFYASQKAIENDARNQELKNKEKELRKAKETERASMERQQKMDARGRKKQEKAGLPTISMKTFKNNAEKSTARMKDIHAGKISGISNELSELRATLPDADKMKMELDNSSLHSGKILVTAQGINFGYNQSMLWKQSLSFEVNSGERIAIKGANGSGKTTLIKMITGEIQPVAGIMRTADMKAIYIDQDYSLINNTLTVYEQAEIFNSGALQEHEIKIRLNRFLFSRPYWDKPCSVLSGGEKMRLILCCITIATRAPDMIMLDEPTNNLDIQNTEILTNAINEYKGTLLVISHDEYFLNQLRAERELVLQ